MSSSWEKVQSMCVAPPAPKNVHTALSLLTSKSHVSEERAFEEILRTKVANRYFLSIFVSLVTSCLSTKNLSKHRNVFCASKTLSHARRASRFRVRLLVGMAQLLLTQEMVQIPSHGNKVKVFEEGC